MNICLIGDSIRKGYQPFVEKELGDSHNIRGPEENGGDSAHVLENIHRWVAQSEPDLIHLRKMATDSWEKKSPTTSVMLSKSSVNHDAAGWELFWEQITPKEDKQ